MFLSELIPVEKAHNIIAENQKIMPTEVIKLEKAHKRVNFHEFISQHSSPPFDRSAMDGYALQAQDTFGSSPSNPKHILRWKSIKNQEWELLSLVMSWWILLSTWKGPRL